MILEQIKDNLGLIASIITSSGVIGGAFLYVGKKILDKTLKHIIDKIDNRHIKYCCIKCYWQYHLKDIIKGEI